MTVVSQESMYSLNGVVIPREKDCGFVFLEQRPTLTQLRSMTCAIKSLQQKKKMGLSAVCMRTGVISNKNHNILLSEQLGVRELQHTPVAFCVKSGLFSKDVVNIAFVKALTSACLPQIHPV